MPSIAERLHAAADRLTAAGVPDARLEADVLLAHVLRIDRTHLLARLREAMPDAAQQPFDALLARRERREPLAYITGEREFYGLALACGPGALIPRPETEMLVDIARDAIRGGATTVADVGTGSGAIAVAIAFHAHTTRIVAIDASPAALTIARHNAARHEASERIDFREGDLLDGLGRLDVIVANLPYVAEAEWVTLEPEVRDCEPYEALVAGPRGTEAIDRLLEQAPLHLATGGVVAAEIGASQGTELTAVALRRFPQARVCVMKDLAGLDRVLVVRQ